MFAIRGSILHFIDDPTKNENAYEYIEDGLLIFDNGKIKDLVPYSKEHTNLNIKDFSGKLILPGFVDTHLHYPQTDIIGSYGEQLLHWLNKYAFPEERKFSDLNYAKEVARFFIEQLLRNGTTTAMVFSTVHPESAEAFFEAASEKNMRMISGKVIMDRNVPDYLKDTPKSSYTDSKKLIEKWHGKGRLSYAITPRFAPTCSDEQLKLAQKLLSEHEGLYVQTHLSENLDEIKWVKSLFPNAKNYLDTYHQYGLVTERSVFAHCIHLENDEFKLLEDKGATAAFCPTSNLFLGSGLFNFRAVKNHNISIGLGTDVGAGTSFSMFQTMNEAYKVMQLQGQKFSPLEAFYFATLGSARSLRLDSLIGNFVKGKEADFIVIDPEKNELLKRRFQKVSDLEDRLFALMTLGDDRIVASRYIEGKIEESV